MLEPWQRKRGAERMTVAKHVADLREFVEAECGGEKVWLVGSSWGAMLGLAFAAGFGEMVGGIVLVGCGTFDRASRKRMHELIEDRMTEAVRQRVAEIKREVTDEDERLKLTGEAILPVYAHDPVTTDLEIDHCDATGHVETWSDMVRLQEAGTYPKAFEGIRCPVLMLHGSEDVHPGGMIRDSLLGVLPQIEYLEWKQCGHYPWIERGLGDAFFSRLIGWLRNNAG